jgi:hypothetical protein
VCKHVWKPRVNTFSTCCDGHVFNMKQGMCIINFMLLNVLVGKLYRHFRVRKLVGHIVLRSLLVSVKISLCLVIRSILIYDWSGECSRNQTLCTHHEM